MRELMLGLRNSNQRKLPGQGCAIYPRWIKSRRVLPRSQCQRNLQCGLQKALTYLDHNSEHYLNNVCIYQEQLCWVNIQQSCP